MVGAQAGHHSGCRRPARRVLHQRLEGRRGHPGVTRELHWSPGCQALDSRWAELCQETQVGASCQETLSFPPSPLPMLQLHVAF
eukprot:scaffold431509_cov17-Prasinocladus_malaysianus.AAC.1